MSTFLFFLGAYFAFLASLSAISLVIHRGDQINRWLTLLVMVVHIGLAIACFWRAIT